MKKIWMGIAALVLSATAVSSVQTVTGTAAVTTPDNYGAYVTASSETPTSNGWTTYYTKIGDGNGVMTFDLLSTNKFGYFGLICGSDANLKDFDAVQDYALFGKDTKTTLNLKTLDFSFKGGYTYKATFNATAKKLSLEEKEIGAADEAYTVIFDTNTTFTSSNVIGMAALSDGCDSATVIIDNLKISDLKEKNYYVNNTFNGGATVKDGAMKIGCYDTATDASGSLGSVYLHKDALCTVRFVDESGELLATQKVCWYGSATAPNAPKKEGYDCVGWSENLNNVRKDMVVYPIYEVSKPDDSSSAPADKDSVSDSTNDKTSETPTSSDSGSQSLLPSLMGCFGTVGITGVAIALTMAGAALALKKREDK